MQGVPCVLKQKFVLVFSKQKSSVYAKVVKRKIIKTFFSTYTVTSLLSFNTEKTI